jgi:hypothetical protein
MQWNFAIDAMAFAAFLLLMSTGLLLRYQLPGRVLAAKPQEAEA